MVKQGQTTIFDFLPEQPVLVGDRVQCAVVDYMLSGGDEVYVQLYPDEQQFAPQYYSEKCEVIKSHISWCTVRFPNEQVEKIDVNKLVRKG